MTQQALWGNLPEGANIALNSPAVNRGYVFVVALLRSGSVTLHYQQPISDIANLYSFPLNPFRYIIPLSNPLNAGATHTGNGLTQPPPQ